MSCEDNSQTFKIECGLDKYFSEEIFVSKLSFSTDSVSADKSSYTKKCVAAPLQMKFSQYLASMFDQFTGNFKYEVIMNILANTDFNIQKEALDAYSEKIAGAENLDITNVLTPAQQIEFYQQCSAIKNIPVVDRTVDRTSLTKNQFLSAVKNHKHSHTKFVTNSISFRIPVLDVTVDVRTHLKLTCCPEEISMLPRNEIIRIVPGRKLRPIKYVKAVYACGDLENCHGIAEEDSDSDSDSDSDTDSDLSSVLA